MHCYILHSETAEWTTGTLEPRGDLAPGPPGSSNFLLRMGAELAAVAERTEIGLD